MTRDHCGTVTQLRFFKRFQKCNTEFSIAVSMHLGHFMGPYNSISGLNFSTSYLKHFSLPVTHPPTASAVPLICFQPDSVHPTKSPCYTPSGISTQRYFSDRISSFEGLIELPCLTAYTHVSANERKYSEPFATS